MKETDHFGVNLSNVRIERNGRPLKFAHARRVFSGRRTKQPYIGIDRPSRRQGQILSIFFLAFTHERQERTRETDGRINDEFTIDVGVSGRKYERIGRFGLESGGRGDTRAT